MKTNVKVKKVFENFTRASNKPYWSVISDTGQKYSFWDRSLADIVLEGREYDCEVEQNGTYLNILSAVPVVDVNSDTNAPTWGNDTTSDEEPTPPWVEEPGREEFNTKGITPEFPPKDTCITRMSNMNTSGTLLEVATQLAMKTMGAKVSPAHVEQVVEALLPTLLSVAKRCEEYVRDGE